MSQIRLAWVLFGYKDIVDQPLKDAEVKMALLVFNAFNKAPGHLTWSSLTVHRLLWVTFGRRLMTFKQLTQYYVCDLKRS